jgi:hypothetical protein
MKVKVKKMVNIWLCSKLKLENTNFQSISVSVRPNCNYVSGVTASEGPQHQGCHCARGVTTSGVSLHQGCHCVRGVTASGVSLRQGCHCVRGVTASGVSWGRGVTASGVSLRLGRCWVKDVVNIGVTESREYYDDCHTCHLFRHCYWWRPPEEHQIAEKTRLESGNTDPRGFLEGFSWLRMVLDRN